MKKISLLLVGLFLVMGLSGCGKVDKPENTNNQTGSNNENSEVQSQGDVEKENNAAKNETNTVEKLKNAISSGKKMKCVYKMGEENGSTEVITYMQGDKYKTEVVLGQMTTTSIFDGDAVYSWVAGQKVGTKMTMDCIDSLDAKGETETPQENVPVEDGDSFMEKLSSAQNLSCEDAADIDFTVPDDIDFSDQCEMLKSQQKIIEGLNQ